MDDINQSVRDLRQQVHLLDRNVAVLNSQFLSLDGTIKQLTSTVQILSSALEQARGADKILKVAGLSLGTIISACLLVIAFLELQKHS